MDFKNKSILLDNVTSFDVNKAIQRSLTKAVARHGLGLYIYAGEDLPEAEQPVTEKIEKKYIKTIEVYAEKYATIKNGKKEELIKYYLTRYGVKKLEDLSNEDGINLMKELNSLIERSNKQ